MIRNYRVLKYDRKRKQFAYKIDTFNIIFTHNVKGYIELISFFSFEECIKENLILMLGRPKMLNTNLNNE